LILYVKENVLDLSNHLKRGWGNGYVAIPPTHPLWGLDYSSVYTIDVHGIFTYSVLNNSYGMFRQNPEVNFSVAKRLRNHCNKKTIIF
jgi:hypothetical protein